MSASASKKKRKEQQAVASPAAKNEGKSLGKKVIVAAIAIVVALALVISVGLLIKSQDYKVSYDVTEPVMTVGSYEVTVPMFNYFYSSILNNYLNYGYLSYGLIETDTALSEQTYMGSYGSDDTLTWEAELIDETEEQITNTINLYLAAKESGYELTEDDKAAIEESVEAIKDSAKENGYNFFGLTVNWFMSDYFGSGCNLDNYREFAELTQYCSGYETAKEEELLPTDEEIAAEYAENADDYDVVTYALHTVYATSDGTDEDENATYSDEAIAAAKEEAEAAKESFPEEDSTVATRSLTYASQYVNEEAAAWLFDASRVAGDMEVFSNEAGTTYYVVRFDERDTNDYNMANAYIISFAYDTEGEELEDGEISAADKFEKLTKGVKDGISEEDFTALAEKYDISTGASDVDRHSSYADEVMSFLYDDARKDGDVLTFADDDTSTYFVIRFVSFGEETYQTTLVKDSLQNAAVTAWLEEVYASNTATISEDALANAYTDRTYYSNS